MSTRDLAVLATAALVAGAAGWTLRGMTVLDAHAPAPAAVALASPGPQATTPAPYAVRAPASVVPSTSEPEPDPPDAVEPPPRDTTRLLQDIRYGTEPQRYEGLLEARAGEVPPALLQQIYETDASDRVRLAALEFALELQLGDLAAERALLESARFLPNAAVQREAARRLAELDERERQAAAEPAQAARP